MQANTLSVKRKNPFSTSFYEQLEGKTSSCWIQPPGPLRRCERVWSAQVPTRVVCAGANAWQGAVFGVSSLRGDSRCLSQTVVSCSSTPLRRVVARPSPGESLCADGRPPVCGCLFQESPGLYWRQFSWRPLPRCSATRSMTRRVPTLASDTCCRGGTRDILSWSFRALAWL